MSRSIMRTLPLIIALLVAGPTVARENLSVTQVADGVWVHTTGASFPANGMLVRDGDSLILVDTGWGVAATEALLEWIDRELGLPVAVAVATHFHDDSIGGAPELAARGIRIVGHPMTQSLAADGDAALMEPFADLAPGGSILVGSVEIFYPGPGHSDDNLVAWVPSAKVLFGGCAVRSPEYPGRGNTADADVAHWGHAIRRVLERYPDAEVVIPGHGRPGGTDILRHTISLFD